MFRNLIRRHARTAPDAIAIVSSGASPPLRYGRLLRAQDEVVTTLNACGIGRTDRVAMVLPDGPEAAVALMTVSAGAACAPLNPAYRAAEFDRLLLDLNPKALIVPSGSASPAIDVARARDIAVLELSAVEGAEAGLFGLTGASRSHSIDSGFADLMTCSSCCTRLAPRRVQSSSHSRTRTSRIRREHWLRARVDGGRPEPERDAAVPYSRPERCVFLARGRCEYRVPSALCAVGVL